MNGKGVRRRWVFPTEDDDPSSDNELVMGNMLDHLVIRTPSIQDAADALKATDQGEEQSLWNPRVCLAQQYWGYPNGYMYTIYLAEE